MFFAKFIFFRVWRRIAAPPDGFNELFALFVGAQAVEGRQLTLGDDVAQFVESLSVSRADLLSKPFLFPLRLATILVFCW